MKAHAYGNDFLLMRERDAAGCDGAALARATCARHTGIGADGLILYEPTGGGARMRLFNADGSFAEVSGNGVRCLAAWLAQECGRAAAAEFTIDTDGGVKRLWCLGGDTNRYTFRADMGKPEGIELVELDVADPAIRATALRIGNPQCVVLERELDESRMRALGPRIEKHRHFAAGTNVEFAKIVRPDRIEILIWERGVGPTQSSGTGSCAAAVAAAVHGGAARTSDVVAPGGTQRVEWTDEGLFLTGTAEILMKGTWCGPSTKRSEP